MGMDTDGEIEASGSAMDEEIKATRRRWTRLALTVDGPLAVAPACP